MPPRSNTEPELRGALGCGWRMDVLGPLARGAFPLARGASLPTRGAVPLARGASLPIRGALPLIRGVAGWGALRWGVA